MKETALTSHNTFDEFYEGYKLSRGTKDLITSIVLVILGLILGYDALTDDPTNSFFLAASIAFIVYALFIRAFLIKLRLRRRWNLDTSGSNQEAKIELNESGLLIYSEESEKKDIKWDQFRSWKSNNKVVCLYFKDSPNWVVLPLTEKDNTERNAVLTLLKTHLSN